MRTILFTLEYPPHKGGVANYYAHLAKYWPIDEHIYVLNNNKGELIKKNYIPIWSAAYFTLKRNIKRLRIDYILVGQILPLGTVAYIYSLFSGIKYSVFLHGMDFTYSLRGSKKILSRLILNRADKIICANSYLVNKLWEFNYKWDEKIYKINPGIELGSPNIRDIDLQKKIISYNLDNKLILLSLGRLVKRKGVDMTIKALNYIPEDIMSKLIYVVIGSGPEKDYLHNLVPRKIENKVIFLNSISNEDKWIWLKLSDIFIMPSRRIGDDFEGFGIVYLEANLLKKPVIAGDSGGVRDAVRNEKNGLLVNPNDPQDIAKAIIRLFNKPQLRHQLGEYGYKRVIRDFSWERKTNKLLEIIKK